MASKQGKLQQRNNQGATKLLAPPSQEHTSDPWSFLERIDAPQWVDLSLEAILMGEEGFDSWFDRSHKHHVMSLAVLNTNTSWLCLGKSTQGKGPILARNNSKGCQKEVNKPERKRSAEHLNKSGNGQSQSQNQVTGVRVHKGANNTERGSDSDRLYASVETRCTLSGRSSNSECKPSGSFKKCSLCSDRSSVSSSLQACSVEIKLFSSNVRRGSSNVNRSEDVYDTPTSCIGGAQRSRNSSTASYCPPIVKSRQYSEVGVSTCTKLRHSSEFGVSTITKSQFVCKADCQSSGDSVVTSMSGASQLSEEQVGKGCARIWEEGTCELDDNQPLTRGFIADSSTVNKSSLHCQQMSNEGAKSGIKAGRRRLETRVSQVGRKHLFAGKENAPPKENITAANLLQVKDKPFHTRAPLAISSSKTANAKTVGLSFHASEVSKKKGPRCSTQVVPWKSGVTQNLNSGRASSAAHQRKRSEAKQLPVACEKASKSERDLAALVAQHNQNIRSLGLQNCGKGLR